MTRLTSSAAARIVRWASSTPCTCFLCLRCWRRTRRTTRPAPAAVPTAAATTGRTQLRGPRIELTAQDSSSCRVDSSRVARLSGGSTGAKACRSRTSMSAANGSLMSARPSPGDDDLLQLLDGTMDEYLRRAVGTPHCSRDLAVVHPQREAHDQRVATIVRQLLDSLQDARQLVPALHEVL